jgi:hypothetical protein
MPRSATPTVDQLLVLLAVAEDGSLTAAAESFGTAQRSSSLPYFRVGRECLGLTQRPLV